MVHSFSRDGELSLRHLPDESLLLGDVSFPDSDSSFQVPQFPPRRTVKATSSADVDRAEPDDSFQIPGSADEDLLRDIDEDFFGRGDLTLSQLTPAKGATKTPLKGPSKLQMMMSPSPTPKLRRSPRKHGTMLPALTRPRSASPKKRTGSLSPRKKQLEIPVDPPMSPVPTFESVRREVSRIIEDDHEDEDSVIEGAAGRLLMFGSLLGTSKKVPAKLDVKGKGKMPAEREDVLRLSHLSPTKSATPLPETSASKPPQSPTPTQPAMHAPLRQTEALLLPKPSAVLPSRILPTLPPPSPMRPATKRREQPEEDVSRGKRRRERAAMEEEMRLIEEGEPEEPADDMDNTPMEVDEESGASAGKLDSASHSETTSIPLQDDDQTPPPPAEEPSVLVDSTEAPVPEKENQDPKPITSDPDAKNAPVSSGAIRAESKPLNAPRRQPPNERVTHQPPMPQHANEQPKSSGARSKPLVKVAIQKSSERVTWPAVTSSEQPKGLVSKFDTVFTKPTKQRIEEPKPVMKSAEPSVSVMEVEEDQNTEQVNEVNNAAMEVDEESIAAHTIDSKPAEMSLEKSTGNDEVLSPVSADSDIAIDEISPERERPIPVSDEAAPPGDSGGAMDEDTFKGVQQQSEPADLRDSADVAMDESQPDEVSHQPHPSDDVAVSNESGVAMDEDTLEKGQQSAAPPIKAPPPPRPAQGTRPTTVSSKPQRPKIPQEQSKPSAPRAKPQPAVQKPPPKSSVPSKPPVPKADSLTTNVNPGREAKDRNAKPPPSAPIKSSAEVASKKRVEKPRPVPAVAKPSGSGAPVRSAPSKPIVPTAPPKSTASKPPSRPAPAVTATKPATTRGRPAVPAKPSSSQVPAKQSAVPAKPASTKHVASKPPKAVSERTKTRPVSRIEEKAHPPSSSSSKTEEAKVEETVERASAVEETPVLELEANEHENDMMVVGEAEDLDRLPSSEIDTLQSSSGDAPPSSDMLVPPSSDSITPPDPSSDSMVPPSSDPAAPSSDPTAPPSSDFMAPLSSDPAEPTVNPNVASTTTQAASAPSKTRVKRTLRPDATKKTQTLAVRAGPDVRSPKASSSRTRDRAVRRAEDAKKAEAKKMGSAQKERRQPLLLSSRGAPSASSSRDPFATASSASSSTSSHPNTLLSASQAHPHTLGASTSTRQPSVNLPPIKERLGLVPTIPHSPAFASKTRVVSRAAFDKRVSERIREEEEAKAREEREREEQEEREVKEMRKTMYVKANPVPEWYYEQEGAAEGGVEEET